MAKRPDDLIYAVDDMPPWPRLIFLGLQHALLMSVYLVLIVIVFRRAGAAPATTMSALGLGLAALAVGTALQAMRLGPSAPATWRHRSSRRSMSGRRSSPPKPAGCRRSSA